MRALALAAFAITPIPAAWSNYSRATMPASDVRRLVVHVTEGSYEGTVKWFRNPAARVASHFVVARDGRIAQMVPLSRPAWHAGHSWTNAHSIGIEHEGYAGVDGTLTDGEYRASARLAASLLKRFGLPADRRHVIGHVEVPGPGGYSHHTDPGMHWDWPRYMRYVRAYRAGGVPPPPFVDVSIPALRLGQGVTGLVSWRAAAAGAVDHVDFLVDGVVRSTLTAAPFAWAWDTALENDGRHVLTARAVAADGRTAISTVVVRSQTAPPPPPTVALPELPPLAGVVPLTPVLGGGPVSKVELWIDGVPVQTVTAAPWTLTLDVASLASGPHTLAVRAVGVRGRAAAAVTVVTIP